MSTDMSVNASSTNAAKPAKRHEDYWDIIRGICILLVFAGHAIGGWNFITNDFLYPPDGFYYNFWVCARCLINCSIPVFIFISGYMVSSKYYDSLGSFYSRRALRLLPPFVIWSAVYVLVEIFVYHTDIQIMGITHFWYGIQLYYLPVLFQLALFAPVFFIAGNKKAVLIATLVINLINNACHVIYHYTMGTIVPNELVLGTGYIFFYTLGLYLRNTDPGMLKRISVKLASVMFAAGLAIYITASLVCMHFTNSATASTSFLTVATLICAVSAIVFLYVLRERTKGYEARNPVMRMLRWFGLHSLDFFLVHWVFENYIKIWLITNVKDPDLLFLTNIPLIAATVILCVIYSLIADLIRGRIVKASRIKISV